jgi:hypothetical protein
MIHLRLGVHTVERGENVPDQNMLVGARENDMVDRSHSGIFFAKLIARMLLQLCHCQITSGKTAWDVDEPKF